MNAPAGSIRCPDCDAAVDPAQSQCWLCHHPVVIDAEIVADSKPPPGPNPFQFSIQSLLLITTLVAVCLGALVTVPGLGGLVIVIAIPALVRTCVTGAAMKREGHKLTTTDKIMSFFASAAIAWAAFAAAGIAFCATCTVSFVGALAVSEASGGNMPLDSSTSNVLLGIGFILCIAAALGAFVGMFWITRPYVPKRP